MSDPIPITDVMAAGGFSVERVFGWGPETIALGIMWGGLLGVVAPGPSEDPLVAAGVIAVGFVLLALRLLQRRNRVRVVAFPERNYVEIFSKGKLSQRARFTSLAIVIQNGANTFGPAFALTMLMFVFFIPLSAGPQAGLLGLFALGAALLCGALLASHLRTRLFRRRLVLPTGEILIPRPEAEQIGLELALFMVRDAVANPPGTYDWTPTLSRSLVKIGDQRRGRGNLAGALAAYEESLAIDRMSAAAEPGKAKLQDDISATQAKIDAVRQSMAGEPAATSA
jgi:hypothetical protein